MDLPEVLAPGETQPTPQIQRHSVSVVSVPPSKRRSRSKSVLGLKRKAASTLVKWWRLQLLRIRLEAIRRNAAARVIQSVVRGHQSRKRSAQPMEERRREYLAVLYALVRRVALSSIAARHVPFIAARRIQLAFAKRKAVLQCHELRKARAKQKIIRAFHTKKLAKYMRLAPHRAQMRRAEIRAAILIQRHYRGYLCRKRFVTERPRLEQLRAERLPRIERQRRVTASVNQFAAEAHRLRIAAAIAVDKDIVSQVLCTPNPNHIFISEVLDKSEATNSKLRSTRACSDSMMRLTDAPLDRFVPQEFFIAPSARMQELLLVKAPGISVPRLRSEAAYRAERIVQSKIVPEGVSPVMRYVLQSHSP